MQGEIRDYWSQVVAGVDESIVGQRSSCSRRTASREWAYHPPLRLVTEIVVITE